RLPRPGESWSHLLIILFQILLLHLLVNDGVPRRLALVGRHVMLARPAPQLQFFDQIQVRHYTTKHKPFPHKVRPNKTFRGSDPKYIGRKVGGKELFANLAPIPRVGPRLSRTAVLGAMLVGPGRNFGLLRSLRRGEFKGWKGDGGAGPPGYAG